MLGRDWWVPEKSRGAVVGVTGTGGPWGIGVTRGGIPEGPAVEFLSFPKTPPSLPGNWEGGEWGRV